MSKLDLVDWTMQEARQLSPAHQFPEAPDSTPSLTRLLEVLEGGRAKTNPSDDILGIADADSIQSTDEKPAARQSPDFVAEPTAASAMPVLTAPSTTSVVRTEQPKSTLLTAVVASDLYTTREDRDRAIILRWVLRDIKGGRLKWSPVNQRDLRTLIDLGLVEMRDDKPVLTNAGVSAAI
jgi:hypothetical protein